MRDNRNNYIDDITETPNRRRVQIFLNCLKDDINSVIPSFQLSFSSLITELHAVVTYPTWNALVLSVDKLSVLLYVLSNKIKENNSPPHENSALDGWSHHIPDLTILLSKDR